MPKTPMVASLRRLRQRRRVSTHQLEEMYHLVKDMEMDLALEIEERKKELEEAEKKGKEKAEKDRTESIFKRKMSFGQTLMFTFWWQIVTTLVALALWFR